MSFVALLVVNMEFVVVAVATAAMVVGMRPASLREPTSVTSVPLPSPAALLLSSSLPSVHRLNCPSYISLNLALNSRPDLFMLSVLSGLSGVGLPRSQRPKICIRQKERTVSDGKLSMALPKP